jgi:DNA-binding IclR family transcriptional regulator
MAGDDVRGIQSIELGGAVLRALIDAQGTRIPLREVANAAGMSASKARRYLLSFERIGLVSQDPETAYYELGPLAIRLGLAALASISVDRVAPPVLSELRRQLHETIVLAIWSDNGPTALQVQESPRPVSLNARIGTTFPMTTSATGLIFCAYYDPAITAPRVAAEAHDTSELAANIARIRAHGIAHIEGTLLPGVSALGTPVFDHNGKLVAALIVVGHGGILDTSVDGKPATALKTAAALLSSRCGYVAPA